MYLHHISKRKKIGLVGKGLLFDTGGYNIKTAMMELMKFDCGGAAAVLGAARAVGEIQPPGVEAHFIVSRSPAIATACVLCRPELIRICLHNRWPRAKT